MRGSGASAGRERALGLCEGLSKPGDFAHAMAAVVVTARTRLVVIGALGGKPLLLEAEAASIDGATRALQIIDGLYEVRRHMQIVTLRRALAEAGA